MAKHFDIAVIRDSSEPPGGTRAAYSEESPGSTGIYVIRTPARTELGPAAAGTPYIGTSSTSKCDFRHIKADDLEPPDPLVFHRLEINVSEHRRPREICSSPPTSPGTCA